MTSILDIKEKLKASPTNEAKFNKKKIKKVSDLLAKLFGKELGGEFKQLGGGLGFDTFKKKDGTGSGYKYINDSGNVIRFGWMDKNSSQSEINVIDFWDKSKGADLFGNPTTTVYLFDWMNIVDVVKEVQDALIGKVSEASTSMVEKLKSKKQNEAVQALNEWTVPKKMIQYAQSKGIKFNGESGSAFTKKLKDAGVWDEEEYKGFKVVKNDKETNSTMETVKKAEKKLDSVKYSDPEVVFDDIEKLTKVVAMGLQNSLIVCGIAGVGKTYGVEKTLRDLLGSPTGPDAKWRYRQGGKISPMGLYQDLFMNRNDMLICFDDTDSVFSDDDAVNMLKAALDTKKERVLFWNSPKTQNVEILTPEEKEDYFEKLYDAMVNHPEWIGSKIKLPNTFEFTSRVIFISNLPGNKFKTDKHLSAIASRSLFMDIQLRREDIVNRIKSILPFIEPNYSMEEKEAIVEELAKSGKQLTMRSVIAAIAIKEAKIDDWERLTREYTGV